MLIKHLPPDSATARALNGGAPVWGQTEAMLADVYDAIQWTTWVLSAQGAKRPPPDPTPYPRPGDPKPLEITAEMLLNFRERTKRG